MAQVGISTVAGFRGWYAHTAEGAPEKAWEPLAKHLERVALGEHGLHQGAGDFADAFGARGWGELAGWWHDLGKYSRAFQDYLLVAQGLQRDNAHVESAGRVDHSTYGARHAMQQGGLGWLLAYVIAGHHGGMSDFCDLEVRLKTREIPEVDAPPDDLARQLPEMPRFASLVPPDDKMRRKRVRAFQCAFWTRMVFSSLVDADFLATESFMNASRREQRLATPPPDLAALKAALDAWLDALSANAGLRPSTVNLKRAEVLAACREKAACPPGFFSLTVPTGGGKTFSSLAFALDHARMHELRRVIYAIPFTSIIEQNAEVFRDALKDAGENPVLEHHSTFEPRQEDKWSRLASENWDHPLIVTTTVQLYESLFANKPSRCRKLHRIAKSVIILDEAQSIPVTLLEPTLTALHELVRNYGCTIVLCTATQPAVVHREDFPIGLPEPTEIMPDVAGLFDALKRVTIEPIRPIDDEALADELAAEPQVLAIVYTKPQTLNLFDRVCDLVDEPSRKSNSIALSERTCFHLTTNMCAQHRSDVLKVIRKRLDDRNECRVISTSLIEAGVDIDFPVVYRALAGLDSIAQAAGRCNREGSLEHGRVVVYKPEGKPPPFIAEAVRDALAVARRHDDLLSHEAITAYFEEHYWQRSSHWDDGAVDRYGTKSGSVMGCFGMDIRNLTTPFSFDFRTAAERYRLIEDEQTPILVPWGEKGSKLLESIRTLRHPADRDLLRRCQRYSVGVRRYALQGMLSAGALEETEYAPGLYLLVNTNAYDEVVGLNPNAGFDPEWLML